jgi:hypothetical protein
MAYSMPYITPLEHVKYLEMKALIVLTIAITTVVFIKLQAIAMPVPYAVYAFSQIHIDQLNLQISLISDH